jgi:hypothetical protein
MVDVVCCIYTLSYYLCNPDTAGSAAGEKQHAILIHSLSTCSVLLLCDTPLLCRYSLGSPVLRGNWNSWLNPDDGICLLCPAHARVDITYSIYCKKQPSFPLQLLYHLSIPLEHEGKASLLLLLLLIPTYRTHQTTPLLLGSGGGARAMHGGTSKTGSNW